MNTSQVASKVVNSKSVKFSFAGKMKSVKNHYPENFLGQVIGHRINSDRKRSCKNLILSKMMQLL